MPSRLRSAEPAAGRPTLPVPPRYDRWPVALQHAMRLRGALVRCGPGMRGVGWPDSPGVRLAALGAWLGEDLCASHLTAAWVWAAAEHPGEPLRLAARAGGSRRSPAGVRRYELRLGDGELERFGGLPVTTRMRTLLDLLHDPSGFSDEERHACRALLARIPDGAECVSARLLEHRRPHRRLAVQRLGLILAPEPGQPELTR